MYPLQLEVLNSLHLLPQLSLFPTFYSLESKFIDTQKRTLLSESDMLAEKHRFQVQSFGNRGETLQIFNMISCRNM